jgi:hypothetical protein
VNCDCHDPIVFGHDCETFTAIATAFRQLAACTSQTTLTWQELARIVQHHIKPRETHGNQDKP